MDFDNNYLSELKKRKSESRAYTKHQLLGLEISQILSDEKHKALYIKLAKNGNPNELLDLAKQIAGKKGVNNKGAYFMKLLQIKKDEGNRTTKQ